MQTISATPAVVNTTTSATVVKHDTSAVAAAKPSIKLGANAKVVVEKKPAVTTPMERLQTMESATRNWEANELAASNKRLYSILMDAYTYYMTMKTDSSKDSITLSVVLNDTSTSSPPQCGHFQEFKLNLKGVENDTFPNRAEGAA